MPFSDEPPEQVKPVTLSLGGPTKRSFTSEKSGFTLTFALTDNANRPTRSDGEVEVTLVNYDSGVLDRKKIIFKVRKEDFGREDAVGCIYRHQDAILNTRHFWIAKMWFKTPDGRKLYGNSELMPDASKSGYKRQSQ